MSARFKADAAMTAVTAVWGATFVVMQRALDDASVFVFMVLRFGIAALALAVMYRRTVMALTREELRAGARIGLALFAGYACQNGGLLFTTPSKAAFITGAAVVMVPVLLALFWRQALRLPTATGAALAFAGLYFLTVPPGVAGLTQLNRGDIITSGCVVMFALHIIFIGHAMKSHSVGGITFVQVAVTALLSLAAIPVFAQANIEAPRLHWTPQLIGAALLTGLICTAAAFSVQVWAQRHTPPTHIGILLTLEPAFAAITSYIVLGERLGARALIGAVLILAGILLAELKGPMQSAADSPGPVMGTPI